MFTLREPYTPASRTDRPSESKRSLSIRSNPMIAENLFDAPDDNDPDDNPDDRNEREYNPANGGGEYILHFRDSLGRFTDPPDER